MASDLQPGQVQVLVLGQHDVRGHRRVKPVARPAGNVMLEHVGHFGAGDDLGTGDHPPERGAGA